MKKPLAIINLFAFLSSIIAMCPHVEGSASSSNVTQYVRDINGMQLDIETNKYYFIENKESNFVLNAVHAHRSREPLEIRAEYNDGLWETHRLFQLVPAGGRYYFIKNKESNFVLNVVHAHQAHSSRDPLAVRAEYNDGLWETHRLFQLVPAGGGYYFIKNKESNFVLNAVHAHRSREPLEIRAEYNDGLWETCRLFKFKLSPEEQAKQELELKMRELEQTKRLFLQRSETQAIEEARRLTLVEGLENKFSRLEAQLEESRAENAFLRQQLEVLMQKDRQRMTNQTPTRSRNSDTGNADTQNQTSSSELPTRREMNPGSRRAQSPGRRVNFAQNTE